MADINVERKGPSIWPWVIGLLVLALLIWAIAEMVDTDEEFEEVVVEEPVEEVEEPPAAVPEPEPMAPEAEAAEIETLMPLGPEDAGQRAEIEGTVVGEPTDQGFWVMTEDQTVLFVRSDRQVTSGEDIDALFGMLETAPEQRLTQWADQARLEDAEDYENWDVEGELYLNTMAEQPAPAQPMQPAPQQPQQPQQPGKTPGQQQPQPGMAPADTM